MAMLKVQVTSVGESLGIPLPQDVLGRLRIGQGDTLYLVEHPDGLTLTCRPEEHESEYESQMQAADKVLHRYRHALRELAK